MFTGNPIQITAGKDISLSTQGLDRPTVILPGQVYPTQQTPQEFFNPNAFPCAGPGTGTQGGVSGVNTACARTGVFGNLGRNSVYGPGQGNFDMALSRHFKVTERLKMEFRADFFNILNHGNWSSIGTSVSSGTTFGQVTSFGSPRLSSSATFGQITTFGAQNHPDGDEAVLLELLEKSCFSNAPGPTGPGAVSFYATLEITPPYG